MTQEELLAFLRKANIDVNTGGLMPEESAGKFIDTVIDQSQFLKLVRTEKGIVKQRNLDTIGVSTRLMYKSVEGTDPTSGEIKAISVGQRTLVPVEVSLPYNIGMEWLRKNIAGGAGEDQVNAAFAKQFANDLVDLAFNGDTTGSGFVAITHGYLKRASLDASTHEVDRSDSEDWKGIVFPALYAALPYKYRTNPDNLILLVNPDCEMEYRQQLADRATGLGDAFLTEGKRAYYQGIVVEPCFALATSGQCMLTIKQNLAVGFGRDIEVYRQINPRASLIEYTIKASVDANYVLSDTLVWCE